LVQGNVRMKVPFSKCVGLAQNGENYTLCG
jgi:hypothetical protein